VLGEDRVAEHSGPVSVQAALTQPVAQYGVVELTGAFGGTWGRAGTQARTGDARVGAGGPTSHLNRAKSQPQLSHCVGMWTQSKWFPEVRLLQGTCFLNAGSSELGV
jgi:hypothetical protein